MQPLPFQGTASALSSDGLTLVTNRLGVRAPEIWTVLAVETSGCGYLPDRRPQILYERHVFHRLTHGHYDDGDISDPTAGGYGATGAHQYDRLAKALVLDRNAALQSTSWGLGQIMGQNHALAGFGNVEDMVKAMSDSEDRQLAAMGNFLTSTRLDVPLQAHDWTAFARGYNGPNYSINQYNNRLTVEFQKYSVGLLPDLNVRATQLYLTYLGFQPGSIDGIPGVRTLSALAQFQARHGLQIGAAIGAGTVAQLFSMVLSLPASMAASA
jgi:hypothetical protein